MAAATFRFGGWLRFRMLELPFATIGLVWNSMLSWAGGWFFLMAAESFTVGRRDFRLPGLGSYLRAAADAADSRAILLGVAVLVGLIVALDQLAWRPLFAYSHRFKVEMTAGDEAPSSWFLRALRSSRALAWLGARAVRPALDAVDATVLRRWPPERTVLATIVQIAASVPATALFPIVLLPLLRLRFGQDVAAVTLMLMGTQWYLLFNVIAGTTEVPEDLRHTARVLSRRRWRWWPPSFSSIGSCGGPCSASPSTAIGWSEAMESAALVELEQITVAYEGASRFVAIEDVSMRIGDGELVALLGPSGCGKSTLLRIAIGLQWRPAGGGDTR